ncbi:MAG: PQQ-binding-like beta-propeller repeat protein [Phycisphaeraceae bacterium]|nr:PQQ-binding-like beta-propeller repeat protein [Phycisphaeraceae bacterium]
MTLTTRSSRDRHIAWCSHRDSKLSRRRVLPALATLTLLTTLAACSAPNGSSSANSSAATGADATTAAQQRVEQLRSQLDRDLLAGPSVAEGLGYRTLWQTRISMSPGATLRGADCTPEEVFVWDSNAIFTRLRPSSGDALWQAASTSRVDRILSVLAIDIAGAPSRVALLTDTQCMIFDASNGTFVDVQRFRRMANTPAAERPPFLIYGTQAGQVVWHDYIIGSASHVSEQAGQFIQAPRLIGNVLVAASTGGAVAAYQASTGRLIWEQSLGARIDARPAANERAVWVPSHDQYLSCLSLSDGRILWRYFTQARMSESPTLLLDSLYLQLPGEGLVSFDPLSPDRFEGTVRWRSPEVRGDIVGACRAGLVAWDPALRRLTLLEERTGSIIRSFDLPGVVDLNMTEPVDGDFVLVGEDGRVQRLTPIVRRTQARS